jgi:5-methylthioadenosine/S-adenosylhomocysteine deaminase
MMTRAKYFRFAALLVVLPGPAFLHSAETPPAKLLVKNAYIFSMAPTQRDPFRGYLIVSEDGTLVAIASGDPPAALHAKQVWDAGGHWIIPGFISAHSHLWQSAYRGLASDQTLHGWIRALYMDRAIKAAPEDFYWFTLHGALDHLQHGITAAYNFAFGGITTFGFGSTRPTETDLSFNENQFHAEIDSGLRFVHGYQPGMAGPNYSTADARQRLKAFLDWTAAQPKSSAFLSTMLNGATAFNNTYEQAVMEAALMKEFNLANESHYLEPPETQGEERTKFRWFMDSGLLSKHLIFGHFIHTDAYILEQAGHAGAAMSWNPLSNGRLASGVADIPAYLKAGIRVGMGVDGEASADLADPFENLRTGLYAIRDKYESAAIMSPYDVLRLHTLGSADVLEVADKLGSLETGKLADFLVIDPSHFGHIFDPYATLVFVTSEPDLERVYVGGELLVERGKLVKHDFAKIQEQVDKRVAASTAASLTSH